MAEQNFKIFDKYDVSEIKIQDAGLRSAINIKPKQFLEMLDYILNLELSIKTEKIDNINLYLQASLRKFIVLFR